jgi:50S ribosomal protein L16 3-hydroxylase
MPLKILANFEPEQEFVLEPGDMLYLPPRYAHDGIAEGDCMTYSIGFRAPAKDELAREILQRMADHTGDVIAPVIYKDPKQPAVQDSAEIPASLVSFARDALQAALSNPAELQRAVGEYLTEPKSNVWFEAGEALQPGDVRLDRRSRMLFDAGHAYLNGESFRASGSDARLIRKLAQERELPARDMAKLSAGARELASQWCEAGWLYVVH